MAYDKIGYTINAESLKNWILGADSSYDEYKAWSLVLSDIYNISSFDDPFESFVDSNGNIDIGNFIGLSTRIGNYPYTSYLTDLHRQVKGTSLYSFSSSSTYNTYITSNASNDRVLEVQTLGNPALKLTFPYQLVNDTKLAGISKGGEFEGTSLTTLDSPETDGWSASNLLDYTKYRITRTPEAISIYRYRVDRQTSLRSDQAGMPNWQYNSDGSVNYKKHPFKLADEKHSWEEGGNLWKKYPASHFSNGVVPEQFILLVSGAGGSGGYKTWVDSSSVGGSAGAFAIVYLDWSKVPKHGNARHIWVRVPHRSIPVSEPTEEGQCYYNLSTTLSSLGELNVDPQIYKDPDTPIVSDSSNYNKSLSVYSGTNGGYYNKRVLSTKILNGDGFEFSTKQDTYSKGTEEKAFDVIAHAYGGLGVAEVSPDVKAEAARSLFIGNSSTYSGCTHAYLQTRIANSASSNERQIARARVATSGNSAGGSSWFSSGASADSHASLTAYGAGGGGRTSGAERGYAGGSGCVKIYY